ncbi:hypothetical protein TNCV_1903171 [Trichonephila clavipes]|nr:hypothetical protein TNCV_1903171 [Trichonephila clavipes]
MKQLQYIQVKKVLLNQVILRRWTTMSGSELCASLTKARDSLVVKVVDSWPACHEFKSSIAEDPPCREEVLKRPLVDVVWKLGEGVPAQVSSSSLDQGSKLRYPLEIQKSTTRGLQESKPKLSAGTPGGEKIRHSDSDS